MIAMVIGVYLAFTLNDCQSEKTQRNRKKESIASLREDLLKDKTELEDGLENIDTLNYKIEGIFRLINKDTTASDSINYFLSGIFSQPTFYPINFTYQSMMNSGELNGFDISFRKDLLELYNGKYSLIKELDQIGIRNFQDNVIKMIIERGGILSDDYTKSQSFAALARVIMDLLRQRQRTYRESVTLIDQLLKRIDTGEV